MSYVLAKNAESRKRNCYLCGEPSSGGLDHTRRTGSRFQEKGVCISQPKNSQNRQRQACDMQRPLPLLRSGVVPTTTAIVPDIDLHKSRGLDSRLSATKPQPFTPPSVWSTRKKRFPHESMASRYCRSEKTKPFGSMDGSLKVLRCRKYIHMRSTGKMCVQDCPEGHIYDTLLHSINSTF